MLSQRKLTLQREYATALGRLPEPLANLALSPTITRNAKLSGRLTSLKKELSRLQGQTNFTTARQFWQAWEAAQKLQTAIQELTPAGGWKSGLDSPRRRLLSLCLFAIGGSILIDTTLFALFGYLTYTSRLALPQGKLWLFLALGAAGGGALGGTMGLLLQWYHQRH
jgi:hypothetical protein